MEENENLQAALEAALEQKETQRLLAWGRSVETDYEKGKAERTTAEPNGDDERRRALIAADKPDANGIQIRVRGPAFDRYANQTDRPFFVPEKRDRERGEGGVFGNAVQSAVNGAIEGLNNTLEAAYQAAIFWDQTFGEKVMPPELPDIPKPFDVPDTLVNNVISNVAQFVVPFGAAGKAMKAAKLGVNVAASFPKAAKIARPMIQGALADFSAFDGHEARLSNLIESVPALQNPVTEYLAASDDDSELEGRFKNAVEGLGVGTAADGLFKCLRALKAARKARRAAKEANFKPLEEQFVPKVSKDDLSALGDPDGELLVKSGAQTPAMSSAKPAASAVKTVMDISSETAKKALSAEGKNTLWENAISFLKGKVGAKIHNASLGADIEIRQNSVNKYKKFSAKEEKQVLAYYIPDLLEKADFSIVEKSYVPAAEKNIKAYRKADMVVSFDGQPKHVLLTVKEGLDGNFFWDAQIKETPYQAWSRTQSGGDKGVSGHMTDKINISKTAESVNGENVYINFARIDTPDDIKKVMAELADAARSGIDKARRGKMTFGDIEQAARKWTDGQEDAFKILRERRAGEPLNAEQTFAARQLWAASAQKVKELSRLVLENPSDANQFMFRKMLATHAAVQKEIIAARTETARALAQWKMPAGAPEEMASQLRAMLDSSGGDALTRKMAKDVMDMTSAGLVKETDKAISQGWKAVTVDTWNEARIAGLLTNTTTHIVNFSSNLLTLGVAMTDDLTTAAYAKMFGADSAARATDALVRLHGMADGVKDGLRYAWKTVKTGASENPYATKFDRLPVIRSETYGLDKNGFWGKAVDTLGTTIRLPFRFLEASDDFFKAVAGRGALYVEAVQKAQAEVLSGAIEKSAMKKRAAELIENPTAAMRLNAKTTAEYLTFTGDPSDATKWLGAMAGRYPLVRFFMPFTKTPGNVFDFALQHSAFAPLSRKFQADIAAGGIRADRAYGQMAAGTALSIIGVDMALNGLITGGGPSGAQRQALTRAGWQPYSVKIGDKYYSFSRFDPVAMDLSLAADLAEILDADRYGEPIFDPNDDVDVSSLSAMLALKAGNAFLSKSYMTGVMRLVDAIEEPTERKARALAADGLISIVPALSSVNALSAAIARTTDPYAKDAASAVERVKAGIPGLSREVPDRLDLFGRKMRRATGNAAYDMFVPVRVSEESQDPIDREMLKQGAFVPMPNRVLSVAGGAVDLRKRPALYNEYVALAGNGLKLDEFDGMGVKDFLNALVTGKKPEHAYESLSDGGLDAPGSKANYIRSVINAGRNAAIAEMLERHPELQEELARDIERKTNGAL